MVYTKFTKKKVIFLAAPVIEIVNQNLICEPKMAQRIAWLQNKVFKNLSSTLYFEKKNK